MPTRNISLTDEQDAFVERVVKEGEYQNASEAVRDALRVLQQRRREDKLKLKALRAQIKAGVDALDRGDFVEVDGAELEGYLEGLTTPPDHPFARSWPSDRPHRSSQLRPGLPGPANSPPAPGGEGRRSCFVPSCKRL